MAISKYSSKVKLPILRYDVEISYSEVEKPSGIAYILLMMVQSAGTNGFSWKDLMDQFGLPTAMFGVFRDELELMKDKGMVDYSSTITLNTPVNMVVMTEIGEKAFNQGIITSYNKQKSDTALYFPAEGSRKYQIYTPKKGSFIIDESDIRFEKIQFDTDDIGKFIENEKHLFSIRSSEKIFNINHISQSRCSYYSSVGLSFNETLGSFSIIGSKKVDERFIKKYLSIEDLFDNLETNPFEVTDDLLNVSPHEDCDWDDSVFILPSELSLKNEKYVISTLKSNIPGAYVVDKLGDDSDFVIIASKSIGYSFKLIRTMVSITGMDGSLERLMIAKRMIQPEHIERLMFDIAKSQYDGSIISLSNSLQILERISDDSGAESLIKEYMLSTFDVKGVYEVTKSFKKTKWNKMLRSWIVEILQDMDHADRINFCKYIHSTKINISGQQACFVLRSINSKENMELTDNLLKILAPGTIQDFLESMDIADCVAEYINAGMKLDSPVSDLFKKMNYASESLNGLKEYTGSSTVDEYFYSYEAIKPENKQAIVKYSNNLSVLLESIGSYVSSDGLDSLKDLANVYSDISSTLIGDDLDLRKVNGRVFGINMRIWEEDILRKLLGDNTSTLELLINEASRIYLDSKNKVKLIDNYQRKILDNIRHYGNTCAHEKTVFPVDEDEKQKWIDVVEEVDKSVEIYLSNNLS